MTYLRILVSVGMYRESLAPLRATPKERIFFRRAYSVGMYKKSLVKMSKIWYVVCKNWIFSAIRQNQDPQGALLDFHNS